MEEHGWKLVGAWSTVIGDLHEVLSLVTKTPYSP
jgi:hypothetical protein